MVNSNFLRKKYYFLKFSTIIKKSDFLFFWTVYNNKENVDVILENLQKNNLKTLWLKQSIFIKIFKKEFYNNIENYSVPLKTLCFFSYGKLNTINMKKFFNITENIIFVTLILNNSLYFNRDRFLFLKKFIIKKNMLETSFSHIIYLLYIENIKLFILYTHIWKYIILNCFFLLTNKKNFCII